MQSTGSHLLRAFLLMGSVGYASHHVAVASACEAPTDHTGPTFAIYVEGEDLAVAQALKVMLGANPEQATAIIAASIKQAALSEAEVLILMMPPLSSQRRFNADALESLKRRKVIGIGDGAAQLFGKLGLEIRSGSCASLRAKSQIQLVDCELLRNRKLEPALPPFTHESNTSIRGMFIPPESQLISVLDVIARAVGNANYAPIVRQGNYVMVGLPGSPATWRDEYKRLFSEISQALIQRKAVPFSPAKFEVLLPGTYKIALAKGYSTREAASRTFYFKFNTPTKFSVSVEHTGSDHIMLFFLEKRSGRGQRRDAKAGEPLRFSNRFSEGRVRSNKDYYYSLRLTNFDARNPASCRLTVQYDHNKNESN